MVYPISKHIIFFPMLKIFVKEIRGFINIPEKEPFIIASNHESYIDSVLLGAIIFKKINKKVHYIALAKLFRNPIRRFIWGYWAGAIPVYFDERKELAIKEAVRVLSKGDIVGIFPEGPKIDPRIKKWKTGVIRIALNAKVSIIPIGLKYTSKILPMDKWVPRKYKKMIKINIGKQIQLDKHYLKKKSKENLRTITDNLMKDILILKSEI